MHNTLYICSPITEISGFSIYVNDVDVRYPASTSLWVSDSQLRGIEDGKRGATDAGAVGAMVVE